MDEHADIHESDRRDIARLAAGHDAALNTLMDRHQERLFHYLIRQLQNETEAADLAQETFVRVYENRSKFDHRQKFSTWLYTIATNLSRDRLRWRSRHPHVSIEAQNEQTSHDYRETLPERAPDPREHLEQTERAEIVRRAIAALPDELRTPLILSEYENLSHVEIASILDCTPKAVETRLYRARQELRITLPKVLS
jgi:RNA polymerase sigma-70 factor (ECF subfamily)